MSNDFELLTNGFLSRREGGHGFVLLEFPSCMLYDKQVFEALGRCIGEVIGVDGGMMC